MDVAKLRELAARGRIEWSKHTLARLLSKNIPQNSVRQTILTGEVIEEYPQDRPFPSCLVLAWVDGAPYHVVVSLDETADTVYVITAYEPSPDRFEADFRTRR
jgi:hypothetical protein